jgi:hypothetical protein
MCDKAAFRSGHEEDVPRPRTAEELRELAQKKQADREKKSKANGKAMMEDNFR